MKQTAIIMGMTGAGKGTQAKLLAEREHYHVINTGDAVRARLEGDPKLAHDIKAGQLADDELVNDVVASIFDQIDPHLQALSDGYPRRLVQAEWFDQFLAEAGRRIEAVIYLEIKSSTSLARLNLRHREDDKEDAISRRQNLFQTETLAVLEYYKVRNLLHTVDGEADIESVYTQVVAALR